MKLILLPGLDGTGLLFEPLINIMPDNVDFDIITLSIDKEGSIQNQVNDIVSTYKGEGP
ncbi:MAG: hypothetical protein HRU25_16560 [Psychrobium sp.]|nr:hypothetical protein [Psychrobium sp.]